MFDAIISQYKVNGSVPSSKISSNYLRTLNVIYKFNNIELTSENIEFASWNYKGKYSLKNVKSFDYLPTLEKLDIHCSTIATIIIDLV